MIGWLKNLLKDSLVYGIGFGISRFLQIIILPIIAHSLSLSEFGYYSNYVIFYTIAGGFFVMGLDSAVARYYYDSDDELYRSKVFSSAFFCVLIVSVLCVIGLSFYPVSLLKVIGVPYSYKQPFSYVLFTIPALVLNNFFLSWFKWKRQKFHFLINSIGTVTFLLFPLLLIRPINFELIFKVIFYSQAIVAIISTILASGYIRFHISRPLLFSMVRYGFPWMLVFILGISRSYLDRFFLTRYLNDELYGVYNFSVRISTLLSLIITAFDMSFGPLSFSIWNKSGASEFFARLQSAYTFLISVVACGITVTAPILIKILGGEKYAGAENVLPFLLFSAIPLSLINFSGIGMIYAKKSFLSTITLMVGFVAVLGLNFVLTPVYLQYGAVNASLIGHILIIITGYYFSQRFYKIPFHYVKDGIVFLFFLGLSIIYVQFKITNNIYEDILIKLASVIAISLVILTIFFQSEYKKSLSALKNLRYVGLSSNASV
jgi:O-antigen/teichoic acid export membrane protein